MENCTIYSHQTNFEKVVEIVKESLPKAKVAVEDKGQQKSVVANIKGGLFGKDQFLRINYRERNEPGYELTDKTCPLSNNLAGICNYVTNIPAKDKNMQGLLIRKVVTMNTEMAFMAEPSITPKLKDLLLTITRELDAMVFATPGRLLNKSNQSYFADKDLKLILSLEGDSELVHLPIRIDSKYFDGENIEVSEEQIARKETSESFLQSKGIRVNQNLPCVSDTEAVKIRTIQEVIDRTYALWITSGKGDGVADRNLRRVINDYHIDIEKLSPQEATWLSKEELTEEEIAKASWRYESLGVMIWALGHFDVLPYAGQSIDVQVLLKILLGLSRKDFEEKSRLRSKTEILGELDKIYRMHWACVDARINGRSLGGDLNSSVVYERHYAFNWLTNYGGQEWDDISTDT